MAASGQSPGKNCQLYTVIKSSIQQPPLLSSRGQLLAVQRVILFCFIPLLNGQEDLKLDGFSQKKVKEWQCGNVIVSLAFIKDMDRIIAIIVLLFLHLHFFELIFDKLKTGPRPTFSGEQQQQQQLYL